MYSLTAAEIGKRRPVWIALSDLWLDTELDARALGSIAGTMQKSGYSIKELYEIYTLEVAPVVWTNMLSPAGEWVGFDPEWLCERILHNIKQTNPVRGFVRKGARRMMISGTEHLWVKLRELIQQPRVTEAAP